MLAAVPACALRDAIRLARVAPAPARGVVQALAWHRAPMIALADAREVARERVREHVLALVLERVQTTAPALARGPARVLARARVREHAQRRVRMIAPAVVLVLVREAALEVAREVVPGAVTQPARRIAQITVLVPAPADVQAVALARVMDVRQLARAAAEVAAPITAQVNVSSNAVRRARTTAPVAV